MNSPAERVFNGFIVENPTLVLLIGMCPSLAITTNAVNGIYMGLATTFVLALSNVVISAIRKIVPDTVRIPAFIVVIASFVTLVDLVMHAYMPDMYAALGVYIPLIVVNCIIFGRAEAYASKNGMVPSFFDGIGMGLGFTAAITAIGLFREILGTGTVFNIPFMGSKVAETSALHGVPQVLIFVQPPGAFMVLAFLIALMNKIKKVLENRGKDTSQFGEMAAEETAAAKKAEEMKKEAAAKKEEAAKAIEKKEELPEKTEQFKEEAEKRAQAAKEEVKDAAQEENKEVSK
ncbi:MAG: electron transport complex subunit E [Lachnospiraceae bacterium]|nr:electron transport complex subunit E [Lachnospiraceae bacterium]